MAGSTDTARLQGSLHALATAAAAGSVPRAEFTGALRQRLLTAAAAPGAVSALQIAPRAAAPAATPFPAPAGPHAGAPAASTAALAAPRALRALRGRHWAGLPTAPTVTVRLPRRALRAGVAGLAFGVVIAGVAMASSRSLPGQPFYGIKRAAEAVQLDLAHGDQAKGHRELQFARTRLHEVWALSRGAGGGPGKITSTLRSMDAETMSGSSELTRAARNGHVEAAQELAAFATTQARDLRGLVALVPAADTAQVYASQALLAAVSNSAAQQLVTPPLPAAGGAGPLAHSPAGSGTHSATVSPGADSLQRLSSGGGLLPLLPLPVPSSPPPSPRPSSTPTPAPTGAGSPAPSPAPPIVKVTLPLPLPVTTGL